MAGTAVERTQQVDDIAEDVRVRKRSKKVCIVFMEGLLNVLHYIIIL